jgi:two-component system CheB/CheR fusion protein
MAHKTRAAAKPHSARPEAGSDGATPSSSPDDDPEDRAGAEDFLVVGVAAAESDAGALRELLAGAPSEGSFACVVVSQPGRGPRTRLAEHVAPHTSLQVVEVTEPVPIEPGRVYLAPPGAHVSIVAGALELDHDGDGGSSKDDGGGKDGGEERDDGQPSSRTFDDFFRSLACDLRGRAAAVLLAGPDDDGTEGLAEIKRHDGRILAQDLRMARRSNTPRGALLAELVDTVLPARKLLPHLVALRRHRRSIGRQVVDEELPEAFQQIFALVRSRSRHDFSSYERSTIRGCIERRMSLLQLDDPERYVRYLKQRPDELDVLFRELLTGVTSFFRDPEAFEALAVALDELVRDRPEGHVLRVWVPGCSTGEEAYSIAMVVRECLGRLERHTAVQIFATDIDSDAIQVARSGLYPESITSDVSAERLARFFAREDDGYRIRKDLRETLIFAPQNLIADPPFTKLDLLSCRNVLIYLDGRLQVRLLPVFHYALRPGGVLFLGSSESVGNFAHLFRVLDKKAKLFTRKEVLGSAYLADLGASVPADPSAQGPAPAPARRRRPINVGLLSDELLLAQLVPPSVIAHERGDIVHIHGRTGQFLEPVPGPQGTANLFTMAREGLQLELASAIRQASGTDAEVGRTGLRVEEGTSYVSFDLRVRRLSEPEPFRGLYLISFDRTRRFDAGEVVERDDGVTHDAQVAELEREELATVNAELQGKVEELSRANDDLKNLLDSTDVATVVLDNDLHIKRFTERARRVIELIPSDVGRPLADLVSQLRYPALIDDAREVVRTLVFKEIEVEAHDGCWYLVRLVPCRTTENVIDGLVVTFVEITNVKGLQETQRRMFRALESSACSVAAQDLELRYLWAFGPVWGTPSSAVIGKTDVDLLGPSEGAAIAELKQRVVTSGRTSRERFTVTIRGHQVVQDLLVAPLLDGAHALIGVTCISTEIGNSQTRS